MTGLFRELDENQQADFRAWARENYVPGTPISAVWHPVVQAECRSICAEEMIEIVDFERYESIMECGGCQEWHRISYTGDCRDDSERFADPEDYKAAMAASEREAAALEAEALADAEADASLPAGKPHEFFN